MKRRVYAAAFALVLAVMGTVAVRASDGGPYNTNPNFCRHADLTNAIDYLLWLWHECWLPDPPSIPD